MLRICNSFIRSSLHSSWCAVIPNQHIQCCGLKQSVEEKLNIPPKPKKPLSSFFRFMLQERPGIRQKYPNVSNKELTQLIGKEWETVDRSVKQEFESSYRKEFDHYAAELLEYKKKLSPEQIAAIENAKAEMYMASCKRKLRKKSKLLGRPTKPKSSFLLFLEENKLSRGTMSVKEWVISMGSKWQQLGEKEKQEYSIRMKYGMEKYADDMRKWEMDMIKSGHNDVVRKESQIIPSRSTVKTMK